MNKMLIAWMLTALTLVAAPPAKTVLAPDGSESEPGIAFASDPSTGLYLTNGVLCITVHGNTVARFDQNGNTALSGGKIGPNAAYGLAAGDGCVIDAYGAVALGQNNYVGAIVGYAIGSQNHIYPDGVGAGALGVDHEVAGAYSLAVGDAVTIYKSAQGALATGNYHFVGEEDTLGDEGSWSFTSGLGHYVTGHDCATIGLFTRNYGDYSLLLGNGRSFFIPLVSTNASTISVGAGTTTPTATLP